MQVIVVSVENKLYIHQNIHDGKETQLSPPCTMRISSIWAGTLLRADNADIIIYKCKWQRRTWKRRISRGFPAFLRQFWLHFMKNFRKNLQHKQHLSIVTMQSQF